MAAKRMPPVEYLREALDYDPKTGIFRWRRRPLSHFHDEAACNKCNMRHADRPAGAVRANGYSQIKIYNGFYLSHRLAWFLVNGDPMPIEIDHINGNRSDNRIANLRAATPVQNKANYHVNKAPKSGVRGVRQMPWGTYEARIRFNKIQYHIGCFATLEEAAEARRTAVMLIHGEFAKYD